ncbi:heavy metal transporter [Streptomyces sp. NBC_00344]|uniref:heavy metal transporter n=1 Tax=Streptomyces sp. NBC_00344 TaxID=2975720 RepID=UPI002E1F9759
MSQPSTAPRRGRALRIAAAVVVLLALAGYVIAQYVTGGGGAPHCTAGSRGGDTYDLSPEQAVNAATISAVGTARGMPERAVTIALATALQESGLRNLDHGDRDSLGLFQQRPSQGWGNAEQIQDPVYAAGKFYQHLSLVPGYTRLPLTVAAQRVQHSAFPDAYAKHEPDATLLASALTGRVAASFTCSGAQSTMAGDPAKVRSQLVRAFGSGAAPTGRSAGRSDLTVPVARAGDAAAGTKPAGGPAGRRGWELAHWAVANSAALRIERVAYAGREWTAGADGNSWSRPSPKSAGPAAQGTGDVRIELVK